MPLTYRISAGHADVEGLVVHAQRLLSDVIQRSRVIRKGAHLHPACMRKKICDGTCNGSAGSQQADLAVLLVCSQLCRGRTSCLPGE